MQNLVQISRALSDPNRVRALLLLRSGELCACQIIEVLGLAPSTVSKHMTVLRQAGLVTARKEGRWAYYRLARPDTGSPQAGALRWLRNQVNPDDRQVTADRAVLDRVLAIDKETLCKRQTRR